MDKRCSNDRFGCWFNQKRALAWRGVMDPESHFIGHTYSDQVLSIPRIAEIYDYAIDASAEAKHEARRLEERGIFSLLSPLVHGLSARVRCARLQGSTAFRRIGLQVQHHLSAGEGNSVLRILRERETR